ncbi:PepSY domain-containing protein [Ramlibacter tataouinensis]|uniref:PepSY domain-containing protein n=1 Tax=Ramlibacter tataouinensis TaxID=94132 RepID=UPI0022F400C6|nr:PepSY domain-containing protein [Ramlibacter tataouinensis]WBY02347.1 PepSY domain-containing protein [Ramlibacter tataouinensis]
MKPFPLLRCSLLALSLGLAAWPTLADDCDAPVQQWQSREAVRQMAAAQGWQVQRLKIDDGCYEIRGTDSQGRTFKARVDPQTLAIVKIKHKDRARERTREREHDLGRDPAAAHPGPSRADDTGAPPLTTPGTAPRNPVDR